LGFIQIALENEIEKVEKNIEMQRKPVVNKRFLLLENSQESRSSARAAPRRSKTAVRFATSTACRT
jgi:hypothetical protein